MSNKVQITFKHWKTNKELSIKGIVADWVNEQSDRIVVKKEQGGYEDILKNTIIKTEDI